jgi:hypothetical protein
MSQLNSGVYLIRNRKNGESYVGASTDLQTRLKDHVASILCHSRRNGQQWRNAFLAATEDDIEVRILEFVPAVKGRQVRANPELFARERFWLQEIRPTLNRQHTRRPLIVSALPVGLSDVDTLRALASA